MKPEILQTQSWRCKTIVVIKSQQQTTISKKLVRVCAAQCSQSSMSSNVSQLCIGRIKPVSSALLTLTSLRHVSQVITHFQMARLKVSVYPMQQPWPHNVSFFVDNEVLQVPVRNITHIADYSEMQVYSITMQLFAAVFQTNNFSICCYLRFFNPRLRSSVQVLLAHRGCD